ncbi:MAG: nitroreductase family protein [Sedimentisphaeraceae bacterium JB056]
MIDFKVDKRRCIKCGKCINDCPTRVISMLDYPELTKPENCIKCQHCLAICPAEAISILGNNPEDSTKLTSESFPTPESMTNLIKGRRTIRKYKQENVDRSIIDELIETAIHSPTGENNRQVLVTVTDDMKSTHAIRAEILERIPELVKSGTMAGYGVMKYLEISPEAWDKHKADIIFRGAPHILIASSPADSVTPQEDCAIFMSYFELLANAMGLGTVWNGILKFTIQTAFPDLRNRLGIPEDHIIGCAMTFGNPAIRYQRTIERGPANINRVKW